MLVKMHRCLWTAICLTMIATSCLADDPLNDAAKKEKVYHMYTNYKAKSFKKIKDINIQEAMELAEQGKVVFVDVRKPPEIKVSKLPNSVSQLEFFDDPSRYDGKIIVGYCTISFRSGQLAKELKNRDGITMINLRGGILAWVHEGGKVYDTEGKETRRLHVYGKRWDLAPEGYETIKFRWRDKLF